MQDNEELDRLCPDCGVPGKGSWIFCAHCGRRFVELPNKILRATGYVIIGLVIMAFGAFGTCFTMVGFSGGEAWGLLVGPALLALTVLFMINFARSLRKF